MSRINPVNDGNVSPKTKELLDGVQAKLGITPNMYATIGHSPAALEGYLNFTTALSRGALGAKLREQIALAVGQANSCEYCLSAHSTVGRLVGLSAEEMADNRRGISNDPRVHAVLRFAQELVVLRGEVDDAALRRVRDAGFSDREIVEIVANVAVNIFTNYFNHVARTEVDFPKVSPELAA